MLHIKLKYEKGNVTYKLWLQYTTQIFLWHSKVFKFTKGVSNDISIMLFHFNLFKSGE